MTTNPFPSKRRRPLGSLAAALRAEPPPEEPEVIMERALWRLAGLRGLVMFALALMGVRAGMLTLVPDERLQAKAAVQFRESVTVQGVRGEILARNGGLLATTVDMPSLHADPSRVDAEDVDRIASALSSILDISEARLAAKLRMADRRDVTLALRMSPDVLDSIRVLAPRTVLWTRENPTRYYPGRSLASQVLGVVSRAGRGLEGLELYLNRHLRGDTFVFMQQRDRKGRAISTSTGIRQLASPGDTVVLTLDRAIQRAAEEALDDLARISRPEAATAIVMDVNTGEVLALANRPTTNPNDPNRSIAAFRNHGVVDAYEVGSVIKPFIVALALEEKVVHLGEAMNCENGSWHVGRSRIRDDHPHSWISVGDVIKFSSNICTAKQALRLGPERVIGGLKSFGFGASTGVGMGGEASGFLRNPDSIKRIELATTSYGQGMTATGIQLVSALAALGNGGERMQPYIVSEIRDRVGEVQMRNRPRSLGQVVSEDSSMAVVKMMGTVLEDGGTGVQARVPGYSAAGKTGTAQKVVDGVYSPTARVASFFGLVPAEDPVLAILVMVDTPTEGSRYGGTVAGPAFSEIARRSLRYLGVPEDRPLEVSEDEVGLGPDRSLVLAPELVWTKNGSLRLPDLVGLSMRDALGTVDGAGLELALLGSGHVTSQLPPPGVAVHPGERLEIRFQ